jgi:hypothetical protein
MVAKLLLLVTLVTSSYANFMPKHIALARFNGPLDLTQNSSFCVSTNVSSLIEHEGEEGLFAKCDLPAGTMLGEFKGKVYSTPWQVPNDGLFAWKIPRCDDKVLRRVDAEAWRTCGDNGYNYVDAENLDDPRSNPLRFVQQARSSQQQRNINVDLFIANHRIYYYTTQPIETGKEIVIRADAQNWAHARGWHAAMRVPSQSDDAPHGFGSGSSAHSRPDAVAATLKVPRAVTQTGVKHKTVQAHKVTPVVEEPPARTAVTAGGISAAPVWND